MSYTRKSIIPFNTLVWRIPLSHNPVKPGDDATTLKVGLNEMQNLKGVSGLFVDKAEYVVLGQL